MAFGSFGILPIGEKKKMSILVLDVQSFYVAYRHPEKLPVSCVVMIRRSIVTICIEGRDIVVVTSA